MNPGEGIYPETRRNRGYILGISFMGGWVGGGVLLIFPVTFYSHLLNILKIQIKQKSTN